jgi:nucleoside-diphosphate-sugar epimerase
MNIMEELVSAGKKVRIANRSGIAMHKLPSEVELIKADAYDFESLMNVCKGASNIYFCAKPADYTRWQTDFIPMAENVVNAAEVCGAKIIYGDNLYLYGEVDGLINENLPHAAKSKKGIVRKEISDMILAYPKSVIGRASSFYGPYVEESMVGRNIFRAAIDGKAAPVLGNIDMPHSITYIRDFATALVVLAETDDAKSREYNVPNAKAITAREFISMIYNETGKAPKFQLATEKMVTFFGLFNKTMREFKEIMYIYNKPFEVDSTKFTKEFGYNATPHSDGIKATLKHFS